MAKSIIEYGIKNVAEAKKVNSGRTTFNELKDFFSGISSEPKVVPAGKKKLKKLERAAEEAAKKLKKAQKAVKAAAGKVSEAEVVVTAAKGDGGPLEWKPFDPTKVSAADYITKHGMPRAPEGYVFADDVGNALADAHMVRIAELLERARGYIVDYGKPAVIFYTIFEAQIGEVAILPGTVDELMVAVERDRLVAWGDCIAAVERNSQRAIAAYTRFKSELAEFNAKEALKNPVVDPTAFAASEEPEQAAVPPEAQPTRKGIKRGAAAAVAPEIDRD